MASLEAGATFGSYRLIRALGRGGFAQVWEAEKVGGGRRVALKVLTELRVDGAQARERFQQEGRLAASISDPRCVYVFSAETIDEHPVITMELMTGGTLDDALQKERPSARQAVDWAMDIVDGLDAANRVGVVHRDIKPSNCFLDDARRVRIGDFGISKSLGSNAALTQTGSILGTPFYSSPEQIGGEALDFRADMFSVGAVLYEMLSGVRPFEGTNPGAVLTAVLTKEPPPMASHGVQVPAKLERLVQRLLAKQPEKRFESYAALREALRPFSTQGVTAATLARRFGAVVLDLLVLALPATWITARFLPWTLAHPALALLAKLVPQIVYFGLLEGLTGRTLGKWLLRVRVTTVSGDPPSTGRALARASVFVVLNALSSVATTVATVARGGLVPEVTGLAAITGGMQVLGILALLSTMRRRNGFAGLHEILTGTRVVAAGRRVGVVLGDVVRPASTTPDGAGRRIGGFRIDGTLWRREGEALLLAHDEELGRSVWIHELSADAARVPETRLQARRAGSLPWLQHFDDPVSAWDAFGEPPGSSLVDRIREHGPLAWRETRVVLRTLAKELRSRLESGDTRRLSLAHVWIGPDGQGILLPFAWPVGAAASGLAVEVRGDEWRPFLARVVTFCLTGAVSEPTAPPRLPLPEHARTAIAPLFPGEPGYAALDGLLQALRISEGRADAVSRARRAAAMVIAVSPFVISAFGFVVSMIQMTHAPRWINDLQSLSGPYARVLTDAQRDSATDTTARRTSHALQIVLSAAWDSAHANAQVGQSLLALMPAAQRGLLEDAARAHPSPDSTALAQARAWLDARYSGGRTFFISGRPTPSAVVGLVMLLLGSFGAAAVVMALLLRDGPALRLTGITIRRHDGSVASRWRCTARTAAAWSPALLALPGFVRRVDGILLVLAAVFLAGALWALLRQSRGPADLIAGTILVPR